MRAWSAYRSKMKTHMAKKNQSIRGLDRIQRGKLPNTTSKYIENEMSNIKLNRTVKEHEKKITET